MSVIGQPAERDGDAARRSATRCRSSATSSGRGCGSGASRSSTSSSTTPPSAAPASSSCSHELEAGRIAGPTSPVGESLPTPVARLPHEGDLAEEPPPAVRPAAAARRGASVAGPRASRAHGPGKRPMSVDLTPYLDAVPDAVVERIARRPARPGGRPREPRRRHARGDARRRPRSSRPSAGRADPVCIGPGAAALRLPRRRRARSGPTRIPTADYDLAGHLGLRLARAGRRGRRPPRRAVRATAAGRHRPPRLERRGGRRRLDRPGRRRDLRDGRAARGPARRAARHRRRRAGGGADGRHRHGHRDVRPPERHAADARRLGGAGRGRRAAVGHLAPALPLEARCPAPAVRARPGPARDRGRRADHLVDAAPTPTSRRPAPSAPHSEGIIDLLAQAEDAEVAILFKEAGRGGTRVSVRTKPGRRRRDGPDRPVRGRRARPRGRRHGRRSRSPRPGRRVLAEAEPPRRRGPALTMARSSLGPGLDGILVVAKPAGPTSHDVVALVRRLAATKRVGHGGTLDPFASGVLPVFLGHGDAASSSTTSATGRRYRATVCFGASSTTDDLEGELTPAAGPAPDAGRGRGGTARLHRHDLAAAAGLQRDQGRRPAGLRDGACRRDRRAGRRARSRSTPSTSCRGTTPTRSARSPCVDVACSAGTYVRALARDLGEALGSAAYLGALARTASGPFTLDGAIAARRDPGGRRGEPGRPAAAPAARSTPASTPSRSSR